MNSLLELNGYSNTVIEINDERDANVKFNLTSWTDQLIDITSTTVASIPQALDIIEVINYSTANCRFQISIKSSTNPNFYVGSSINFGTLPSGVTLTSNLGVYTLSGINTPAIWNAVKNPTWILPSNYATNNNFYLECKVIWYNEALAAETSIDWDVYDVDYYFIANLASQAAMTTSIGYQIDSIINMSAAFTLRPRNDAELESEFTFFCRPAGELNEMSANLVVSSQFSANVRANKRLSSSMVAIASLGTDGVITPTMKLVIDTTLSTTTNTISLNIGFTVSQKVFWGDGTSNTYSNTGSPRTHTYAVPGSYLIKIEGTIPSVSWSLFEESRKMVTAVTDFGLLQDYSNSFANCLNLIQVPVTISPTVTNLTGIFSGCSSLNSSNLTLWNTGNVTNMSNMFNGCLAFNQNLNSWNTANVTNMSSMFNNCRQFNQPLSNWNTAKVTNLSNTFGFAEKFNQSLSNWNVNAVVNLERTFYYAREFNQNINIWNTSNVTNMSGTFQGANAFNQPLNNWNTAKVTTFQAMFSEALVFNQAIGNWNTIEVTDMSSMFSSTRAFNQSINAWNTGKVTNMSSMFSNAFAFNQSLAAWDTSKVTNMTQMFRWSDKNFTPVFNQDLSGWCVELIPTKPLNFDTDMTMWTLSRPIWGTCP